MIESGTLMAVLRIALSEGIFKTRRKGYRCVFTAANQANGAIVTVDKKLVVCMTADNPGTARLPLHIPREVTALLTALHLQEPDITLLKRLGDHEWHRLLAFCDLSHLTLLLALFPGYGLPDWVAERLKRNLADNTLRFEHIKATYREVADALAKSGLAHVVIKGFTQAPEYVADPGLRAQSDIDLFCLPEDIEAARTALQAIGYRPVADNVKLADHGSALVRLGDW